MKKEYDLKLKSKNDEVSKLKQDLQQTSSSHQSNQQ